MLHEENVQVQKWDEVANHGNLFAESRQGQEEGDELDSQEEASLAEMKSREVVLATERELDFSCFSCFQTAELRTLSL